MAARGRLQRCSDVFDVAIDVRFCSPESPGEEPSLKHENVTGVDFK